MLSHELGFTTSWKMLTRDKGWIKPVLVLTLVSWIPILGQIAVLGYGLEWARLTAWGVDSAPKQRGVKYGKVLSTGGIAFLISLTMGIVLAIINVVLFGGVYVGTAFPMSLGTTLASVFDGGTYYGFGFGGLSTLSTLLMLVVNIFFGTFISAAMMRATLYDSFAAGWRVDRLFQMVGRDVGGFFHTYAVSLIGGLISGAVSFVISLIGALFFGVGVLALSTGFGLETFTYDLGNLLLHVGAFPILVFVIVAILAIFAAHAVSVAMQLVSINAVGQWFCRFEVNRWGVSSAPLPDDVPRKNVPTGGNGGNAPWAPQMPDEVRGQGSDAGASWTNAAGAGTGATGAGVGNAGAGAAWPPVEQPGAGVDAGADAGVGQVPGQVPSQAPVTTVIPQQPDQVQPPQSQAEQPSMPQAPVTPVDVEAAEEAARFAAEQLAGTAEEVEATGAGPIEPTEPAEASAPEAPLAEDSSTDSPQPDEPIAAKKPIPLGPISDSAQESEQEDGPIQA